MNIVILLLIRPNLASAIEEKAKALAFRLLQNNPDHNLVLLVDYRSIAPEKGDSTPWSRCTRARNAVLKLFDLKLSGLDYLLWIDADISDYPADLPTRLLQSVKDGCEPLPMIAPMILVEGTTTFYDWAAFIQKGTEHIEPTNRWFLPGRNLSQEPPYWSQPIEGRFIAMDGVGSVTLVPAWVYNYAIYEDHPAFTDHYPLSRSVRGAGGRVLVDRETIACHANLPHYGEPWH